MTEKEGGEPKLKVCVLAACPFPANHGTPGSIRELSEATAQLGHEVHVVTYHFGEEDIPLENVQLHRIKSWFKEDGITVGPTSRKPIYDLQLIFKAAHVVRKYDCDVIHAHGYEAALAAFWVRVLTWRPWVYSAHNSMGDELASYNFFRFKWVANSLAWTLDAVVPRLGNRCIPHSDNMKQFLLDRGLKKRCEDVINFGIDLSMPPAEKGEELRRQYCGHDGPLIAYAGVMNEFQRLDLLLEAMVEVAHQRPEARLLMVVTIDQPEHQKWIRDKSRELGIEEHVVLTEPQQLEGVQHLLRACDLTVVPRPDAPGFPIKLLNYMAAGKACVMYASSCSGLTHGENVFLAEQDTAESLAGALLEMLADDEARERIAASGHQFVLEHHDRSRTAEKVVGSYVTLLKGSRRWRKKIALRQTAVPGPSRGAEQPSEAGPQAAAAQASEVCDAQAGAEKAGAEKAGAEKAGAEKAGAEKAGGAETAGQLDGLQTTSKLN